MVSYEIGYRGQWSDHLWVNLEGYLNKDKDMMALHKGLLQELQPWLPGSDWVEKDWYDHWDNIYDVTTYGLESSIEWEPTQWWLLRAFHTYLHQTNRNELTNWRTGETGIILSPKHRVGLTNRFKLDEATSLNTQLYWTDTATPYPEYIHGKPFWRLDIRLARRLWNDRAEIAVGAMNLLDRNHYECGYDWGAEQYNEVPRQFYVEFFCKF
jgi:outer membrane receptor for ferrienterochelin and colicin